jgi:hypothetical protein
VRNFGDNFQPLPHSLYGTSMPRQDPFSYLGIPFKPEVYFHTQQSVTNNVSVALIILSQLSSIGINPKDFNLLLAVRFCSQMVRS